MATDAEAPRARDAEIPLANVRSAPKLALARPPPTRQTVRKGRLKFLYLPVQQWKLILAALTVGTVIEGIALMIIGSTL